MLYRWLRYYLILMGLLLNLAIVYEGYRFSLLIYSLGSLPSALNIMAYRISDIPVLQTIGPSLSNIAQSLDQSSYQWKPFKREQWPMVGPDFSAQYSVNSATQPSIVRVSDSQTLINALKQAQPGNTIVVADGEYELSGKRFNTSASEADQNNPIILKAENPGKAHLNLSSIEGIFLHQPYWTITGFRFKCASSNCDHAIHIVSNAQHTSISHNEFIDFNAALKINSSGGQYPDNGIVSNNYFYATKPRNTHLSVTPINIDQASHWVISKNIIRDFIKTSGNKVSYGAFMKGGASNGIFENNLIICNTSKTRYSGSQVGLSIGGGGMNDHRNNAPYEATNTVIRNNIISHCNDVGIYINKGENSLINNNTIYNTSGIDIRFAESSALVINNIFSGKLRTRDNGKILKDAGNLIYSKGFVHNDDLLNDLFSSPEIGNFAFKDNNIDLQKDALNYPLVPVNQTVTDFCGQTVTANESFIGAFSDKKGCFLAD